MGVRERIKAVFAFTTLPVSILAVAVYAAIFISLAVLDDLPAVPSADGQLGLDIDRAYDDLHKIAGLPHPYNSHQNDIVRTYILGRVQDIASFSAYTHVEDDRKTNVTFGLEPAIATFASETAIETYFEGSNILVKVEGTNSDLGSVLFSAHFDSVATSPGATDDGMGVATLISLVEYFSKNQPKRTVVFNINNAEEDGLLGAHAFIDHPWFKETTDFLNLEGAGSGGRPLLLRSTSTRVTKAWAHVPHPHALVMIGDVFKKGLVKGATDYSVYETAGRDGLDFAFYRQRSKYHTKEDSIPSLNGKAALWSMLESSLKAGLALTNDESVESNDTPVYFDLFGETLSVQSLQTFYIMNIVLLVAGPLILASQVFLLSKANKLYLSPSGWGRMPAAIFIGGALTIALGMVYDKLNSFIVYSSPAAVFISTTALNFLVVFVVAKLFAYFLPVPQIRSAGLLECYIFWWILLVFDTVFIGSSQIAGLYFLTFANMGTLIAVLFNFAEHFALPSAVANDSRGADAAIDDEENGREDVEGSNERTPLLASNGRTRVIKKGEINEANGFSFWIMEFIFSVPFPVILLTQMAVMLLNALNQTLADGNPASGVYFIAAVLSTLVFIPLIPFIHKVHRVVPLVVLIVFVVTFLYNVFAFPFSETSPFKVFFKQTIDLDSGNNTVSLTGVNPWTPARIVSELPSSWGAKDVCGHRDELWFGLPECHWSGLEPHVGRGDPSAWLSVNATQTAPGMGLISLTGLETRNCKLSFDSLVKAVSVRGSSGEVQELYPVSEDGVLELELWSRTWDRKFEVSVAWEGADALKGKAACEWAEASAIPAYEEVVSFLPKWARVTQKMGGLLEGYKAFKTN